MIHTAASPSEVQVSSSPWVSGTRAERYADSTITCQLEMPDFWEFEKLIVELLEKMKLAAYNDGCNWVVAFELSIDKDREPSLLVGVGKAAVLTDLYAP